MLAGNFKFVRLPLAMAVIIAVIASCGSNSGGVNIELHKKLAGELRDSRLYTAAVEEYQKILADETLEARTRANINYLIGKIYYENIVDYEKAAAYLLKARSLDPEGSFATEASKKLVASLEKMGNVLDAKRQLDVATDIDARPAGEGDVIVARVGGTPVYLSEIESQIQALPPDAQKQFLNAPAKVEFVHQYVGIELIHRAALRENYGDDPDVAERMRLMRKQLLVEKYVSDKVMPQVKIDTLDVRNYYAANKDSRYESAPYDSVKARVFLDYQQEKAGAAFSDYISNLASVEKVEFFDRNVK
jgi:hypothetical protein